MSKRINVALVGIGGYGIQYLDTLLFDPRGASVNFVGVADLAPERCLRLKELRERQIPIHTSLASLLGSVSVDLLLIATPIHLHATHTLMAVQRNASVMCEKPLAGSWHDAMRMLAAEKSFKGFIGIGYQWSYSWPIQQLKKDIMDGLLGRPLLLKSLVSFPRGQGYFARNDWAGRIRTLQGDDVIDSPVNNAAAHYLHNMLYLLGATRETSAAPTSVQAELYRANDIENYDTACLRCRTENGADILFYTTHSAGEKIGPKALLTFEKAVVSYDFLGRGEFIAEFADGTTKNYGNPNVDRNEKIWHAVEAVHTGRPLPCGVRAAIPHMMCAIAAQRSPIHDFPRALCTRAATDDDNMVVIQSLSDDIRACYDREVLPSELGGISWSHPAEVVEFPLPEAVSRLTESAAVPA